MLAHFACMYSFQKYLITMDLRKKDLAFGRPHCGRGKLNDAVISQRSLLFCCE